MEALMSSFNSKQKQLMDSKTWTRNRPKKSGIACHICNVGGARWDKRSFKSFHRWRRTTNTINAKGATYFHDILFSSPSDTKTEICRQTDPMRLWLQGECYSIISSSVYTYIPTQRGAHNSTTIDITLLAKSRKAS